LMKVTSLAAELERVGQTMSEIMIVERTLQAWKERYPNDEVILRDLWETGNRTKDEGFCEDPPEGRRGG
jgi:FMN-dependent NADH-azoreductase